MASTNSLVCSAVRSSGAAQRGQIVLGEQLRDAVLPDQHLELRAEEARLSSGSFDAFLRKAALLVLHQAVESSLWRTGPPHHKHDILVGHLLRLIPLRRADGGLGALTRHRRMPVQWRSRMIAAATTVPMSTFLITCPSGKSRRVAITERRARLSTARIESPLQPTDAAHDRGRKARRQLRRIFSSPREFAVEPGAVPLVIHHRSYPPPLQGARPASAGRKTISTSRSSRAPQSRRPFPRTTNRQSA